MIEVKNLHKTFKNGDIETKVLQGIDLKIKNGEFVSIMGRSGAGKSTLLYQMSLLDDPTEGFVYIDGVDTSVLSNQEKTDIRLRELGYIFQEYALLPDLNAIENVAVLLLMQGFSKKHAYEKAKIALEKVGLGERLNNLPSQLSGGEQQRVSISRAVAHEPKILFADEPTANLDSQNAEVVLEILKELNKHGQTIVMVTHELEYGKMTDRIINLADGKLA